MKIKISNPIPFMRTLLRRIGWKTTKYKEETQPTETIDSAIDNSIEGIAPTDPLCIRRIRKVIDYPGIRHRKGYAPGVWVKEADSFIDAYRLMLRICDPESITTIRRSGHVRYKVVLPNNEGKVLLSEKVGNRRNTIAVMRFSVLKIPELKEIRFCARDKPHAL